MTPANGQYFISGFDIEISEPESRNKNDFKVKLGTETRI
jgi:hypothetical protein